MDYEFLFVDGENHDVAHPKAIIIRSPLEWKTYVEALDIAVMNKIKLAINRHFGIPVKYPCIVFSRSDPERYVEHYFVYPDDARMLLEIDKQCNKRLARIARTLQEEAAHVEPLAA